MVEESGEALKDAEGTHDSAVSAGVGTASADLGADEQETGHADSEVEDLEPDPWSSRAGSYKPLLGSETILRWTVIGSIVGFFVIGGGFALASYAFGADAPAAIGVGLMTGLLGGPGFGGMMGFVVQYAKYNEHDIG